MKNFLCKCIKPYSCFKIIDERDEKGGPFKFKKNRIYNCHIISDAFWGDCYVVTEKDTGFSIGFDKKEFELYFKKKD